MGVRSAQQQADILKDKGNQYFKKEKLSAAIDAYTEAITLCPSVPVYWTNRALCERKRNEWQKVEADCRKALELDSHSVKAYYMLGLALLQYQQYEEAVKQLEKALDLGRGSNGPYIVEEIWQELAKARYTEWESAVESRQRQQLDLKSYLSQLLSEDYAKQLSETTTSISGRSSTTQRCPLAEEEDLIRLDSGSRHGSSSGSAGKKKQEIDSKGKFQTSQLYSDAELEEWYRSSKEPPPKVIVKQPSWDPLKEHKYSLRRERSLSSALQVAANSQVAKDIAVARQETPEGEKLERSLPPIAAPENQPEEPRIQPIEPEIQPVEKRILPIEPEIQSQKPKIQPEEAEVAPRGIQLGEVAVASSSSGESSRSAAAQGDSEPARFDSIVDVFKVFKEFMKLRQHDAGQKLLRISELYHRRRGALDDVFERATAADRQREIPDHLCCKITMDIFRDPVITPSGITYERASILDHLAKVGEFDPFTRAPLKADQIVPNLALKEAVHAFLDQHGWAYGQCDI